MKQIKYKGIRQWEIDYHLYDGVKEIFIFVYHLISDDHFSKTIDNEICVKCKQKVPIDVQLEYKKLSCKLKQKYPDYKIYDM